MWKATRQFPKSAMRFCACYENGMSSILMLNTALASACAVFAGTDESKLIVRRAGDERQSAQTILQLARQALDEAGVKRADAVAVVSGPGSFTGTRIGIAAAQGLCAAWDVPALPISTLALTAAAAHRSQPADTWLAGIPARADELYFGCYRSAGKGLTLFGREQGGRLEELNIGSESSAAGKDLAPQDFGRVMAAGDGWPEAAAIEARFKLRLTGEPIAVTVEAIDLARLARTARQRGEFVNADLLRPNYVTGMPQYREQATSG